MIPPYPLGSSSESFAALGSIGGSLTIRPMVLAVLVQAFVTDTHVHYSLSGDRYSGRSIRAGIQEFASSGRVRA
jgi:hypothetical protein